MTRPRLALVILVLIAFACFLMTLTISARSQEPPQIPQCGKEADMLDLVWTNFQEREVLRGDIESPVPGTVANWVLATSLTRKSFTEFIVVNGIACIKLTGVLSGRKA